MRYMAQLIQYLQAKAPEPHIQILPYNYIRFLAKFMEDANKIFLQFQAACLHMELCCLFTVIIVSYSDIRLTFLIHCD